MLNYGRKNYGPKILIMLLLLGLCIPAMGQVTMPSGADDIYIGAENELYEVGRVEPLCEGAVQDIVYADAAKLLFVAEDGELMAFSLNAGDLQPQSIGRTATGSVYIARDGLAYYVDQADDTKLMGYDPLSGQTAQAATLPEGTLSLGASVEGLVVGDSNTKSLYIPQTGQFVECTWADADVSLSADGRFETLLTADGTLTIRTAARSITPGIVIDKDVIAVTTHNALVYYLKNADGALSLMSFDYAAQASVFLAKFQTSLLPTMASAGDRIYMIAHDGRVFELNIDSHSLNPFGQVNNMPEHVMLSATNDMLLIYDTACATHMPTFLMGIPVPEAEIETVEPAKPTFTPSIPDVTPKPVEPSQPPQPQNMTEGSRGDDVLTLQQILHACGYPVGKPDGIYGSGTTNAVKYLQSDLGIRQTGIVTPAFFDRIQEEKMPHYEQYVQLSKGDSGIRVVKLQQRLRALRYMDAQADGIYGSATANAVELFEKALSERENGVATVHIQKQLFAKDAPKASDVYSDIEPKPTKKPTPHHPAPEQTVTEDDLIDMTRWLNNKFTNSNLNKKKAIHKVQSRLADLGYLNKKQRSKTYDNNTLRAMENFQRDNDPDNDPTGIPTIHTMELLFPDRLF